MSAMMGWIINGQSVEEIEVLAWISSSILNPSVADHMSKIGGSMGAKAGRYLASRQ
jgi:hypothetical protein